MEIRVAERSDLPRLMELYDAARAFMRRRGNDVQWVGGYPSREMILAGIDAGEQYVCLNDGSIAATFWFAAAPEPTYAEIFDGPGWLDDAPYGVVHRLASDGSVRGVGAFCLEWCLERCGNIRVDTHACNAVMQNLLERLGYSRRGVLTRPSRVATVPIGYADGLDRRLGNGLWAMVVGGCMDSCMIDVTDVPSGVQVGDEVTIFSAAPGNTAADMAAVLDTIPYEVLTSVSARVKRIYTKE